MSNAHTYVPPTHRYRVDAISGFGEHVSYYIKSRIMIIDLRGLGKYDCDVEYTGNGQTVLAKYGGYVTTTIHTILKLIRHLDRIIVQYALHLGYITVSFIEFIRPMYALFTV